MAIKVTLHPFLGDGVELSLEVEGKTVGECLRNVSKGRPAMEKKLFGGNGKLKGYVEVFVNGQATGPQELSYPVKEGDSLWVVVLLAGG